MNRHSTSHYIAKVVANHPDITPPAATQRPFKPTPRLVTTPRDRAACARDKLTLSGNAVDLQAIADTTQSRSHSDSKSFTIGAKPAGMIGDLANAIVDKIQEARATDNNRLKGALALKAGYDAWKFVDKLQSGDLTDFFVPS